MRQWAGTTAAWMALAAGVAAVTLVSVEQEIDIGRQADSQVKAETPGVTDPALVSYVRDLGRRLAGRATGPKYASRPLATIDLVS